MKTPLRRALLAVTLLASAVSLLAADVTGVWHTGLPSRQGNIRPYTFELEQAADGALSGKVIGFRSEGAVQDGKVVGDQIRFSAENSYYARSVLMTFSGVVEGGKMDLVVTFADNDQKLEITATKE